MTRPGRGVARTPAAPRSGPDPALAPIRTTIPVCLTAGLLSLGCGIGWFLLPAVHPLKVATPAVAGVLVAGGLLLLGLGGLLVAHVARRLK